MREALVLQEQHERRIAERIGPGKYKTRVKQLRELVDVGPLHSPAAPVNRPGKTGTRTL